MKKISFIVVLTFFVFACAHKLTPANPSVNPSTTTKEVEEGHALYTAKCGRCHNLKNPTKYTTSEWTPLMKRMAPKARLTEAETAQVTAYVMAYAKK